MKKMIAAAAMTLYCAGLAFAADEMVLKAKNGDVKFNHKKHQEYAKDCKVCHAKGVGAIEGFDKDAAHKLCKGCHEEKKAGPTKCGECHKK
jgi:hypothetical protein